MKNNKGYYSWIHSMKNAALESQFKGQRMLNEANQDDYDPQIAAKIAASRAGRAAEIEKLRQQSAALEAAQRAEIMSGRLSPVSTGGESSRKEAKAHERAMRVSGLSRDVKPVGDITGDGVADAKDVQLDAIDGVIGDEQSVEDEDYWRRTMMPDENTVMKESISRKISRFFRG